jgi:Holliday junction resolvase RusA-like endonuclease
MESELQDLMEVRGPTGRTVSFIVTGDPPVQERPKMTWMRANWPRMYDPSSRKKRLFAVMVMNHMVSHGLTIPYFTDDEPISFRLLLVLPRLKKDFKVRNGVKVLRASAQAFPRKKDVDNMLKFVMDALHGLFYTDDVTVTTVSVTKTFPEIADAGGWMYVQLGTSNEILPLATIDSV